jgi:RimJ/RimL family protein N-acetyltransferase
MDAEGEPITLRDGAAARLRPIRPADRTMLLEGFARLSTESRYRRFLGATQLTDQMARYLTEVDGRDHVAFVVVEDSPDVKEERGLGVGRFIRLPNEPTVAECALTVVDDHQQRGIGTALARALCDAALDRGVHSFRAEVLATNKPMLDLLAMVGARLTARAGDTLVYDIPLPRRDGHPTALESLISTTLRVAAETMGFVAHTLRQLGGIPPSGLRSTFMSWFRHGLS